ncbi:uncharacterized protein LOC144546617 [Carex rostrata]
MKISVFLYIDLINSFVLFPSDVKELPDQVMEEEEENKDVTMAAEILLAMAKLALGCKCSIMQVSMLNVLAMVNNSATAVPLTVPSSRTPDTGAGEPRRSLRMHAKGDTDSVMKKAQKRKQGEGSSSSTGNMSKKVKNAVGEWIPIIEDAIPLNQYMPLELVPFLSDVEVFSQQGFAAANVLP